VIALAILAPAAQAACVDHDPVVKAIAAKMGFPQFGSCAAMGSFCDTEIPLPEMSISAVLDIPGYDKNAINLLTVGAEELQKIGEFSLPSLLSLACPATCGACPEIDHITLYKENRKRLINALEGIEDLILNGKRYHPCNIGSHGCDKSHGGICYKDGEEGSDNWGCGCEPGYVCEEGCEAPFTNHACERKDSTPNDGFLGTDPSTYAPIDIPTKSCEDHDAVVEAVASAFGVSDCAQVKKFCSNAMPIPAAMIPIAGDPRRAAIPAPLQSELDTLLKTPSLKLSDVLSIGCPLTCQSGCGAPEIEVGSGACANSKDSTLWNTIGKASMEVDMTRCTMGCLANADGAPCISSCMQQNPGYSAGCGDCFGTLGGCIKDNCLMQCMGNDKQACDKCASKKCSPAFETCSGIKDEEEGENMGTYRSLRGDPRRV